MMKRPAILFSLAGLMLAAYLVSRFLGFADHTSAIAGMPVSTMSNLYGPLHIALYMLVVTFAPMLVIAGTIDTLWRLHRRELGSATES